MTNLDYLYSKDAAKNYFGKKHFVDKKIGFQTVKNGIIIPHIKDDTTDYWGISGVLDGEGLRHKGINTMASVQFRLPPDTQLKRSTETVIYLGLFAPAWGHDLTLNLSRFWFLFSPTFKQEFKHCPIVYTPWYKKGWQDEGLQYISEKTNFPQLLSILGVDPNALQPVEQPTQFANVIVPDDSFYYSDLRTFSFTPEYRETIDRIRSYALKNRTPIPDKKIYYFYGRHQIGEENLALYFMSKGYTPLLPERIPLDEQLNYLINCDSFASTLGSCSHNSLFLRDGAEAIFIPRTAYAFTTYQQALSEVHPLNATYIDSSLSIFGKLHESYCFIISKQLREFFGEPFGGYTEDDFKTFLRYMKDSVTKGRQVTPRAKQYYDSVFPDFFVQLWNRNR